MHKVSKRIRVVSPKFYTDRKNFTGPPVLVVLTNLKSVGCRPRKDSFFRIVILTFLSSYVDKLEVKEGGVPGVGTALRFPSNLACKSY